MRAMESVSRLRIVIIGAVEPALASQLEALGLEIVLLGRSCRGSVVVPDCDVMMLMGCCVANCARRFRQHARGLAILVVLRDASPVGVVEAFRAGADACVAADASAEEIVARLRCLHRRINSSALAVVEVRGIRLWRRSFTVWRDGRAVELTPHGFVILERLMTAAGQTVDYSQLMDACWSGIEPVDGHHRLTAAVYRLRAALGSPPVIDNVHGKGYRLDP